MKEINLIIDLSEKVINIINDLVDEANKIHAIVCIGYLENDKVHVHIAYHHTNLKFLELCEELKEN